MSQTRAKIVAAALVGVLFGSLVVTPVGAHVVENTKHLGRHAWRQFIRKKVYTKAKVNRRFYNKSQANQRFYTKGQANQRFYTKDQSDALLNRRTPTYCGQAAAFPQSFPSAPCGDDLESLATVDSNGNVGLSTSIAIAPDGNPTISYYDDTVDGDSDLKVVHCNDPACSGGDETPQTVDSTGDVGIYPSIAIGTDGNPTISYYDNTNDELKVVHCDDPGCAGTETPQTVDSGNVGAFTSIAIAPDGNPTVSYFDSGNTALKIVHCDDPDCVGTGTPATVDNSGVVGIDTSIAIAADGNPVVSYYDNDDALKVAHCDDEDCTTGSTELVDDDGDNVGQYSSIAIAPDGNPVVSYRAGTPYNDLRVVHCNDPDCADGDESPQAVNSDGTTAYYTSIAIAPDGNPVVSYRSSLNGVQVAHCDDPACAAASIQTVESGGQDTSIAIGTDGNATVSYYDPSNEDLKVARVGL